MSLVINSTTTQGQPGYFRIGYVVLEIPPEDIITTKIENNEEITPLRAPYPFRKKTGHSRWDVTVRWKSIINDLSVNPYQEWDDLRSIVAMFKCAPFVEVENKQIRQILNKEHFGLTSDRMAFALRQLRIDTSPDSTDILEATLTMTLFNYYPYSKEFGYIGMNASGPITQVSANASFIFKNYVESWKTQNLDQPYDQSYYDWTPEWSGQTPGTMKFTWRRYKAVTLTPGYPTADQLTPGALAQQANTSSSSSPVTMQPNVASPNNTSTGRLYGSFPLDPNSSQIISLAKAIIQEESQGNYQAANPGSSATGLMQWLSSTALNVLQAMGTGNQYITAAINGGVLSRTTSGSLYWTNGVVGYRSFMTSGAGAISPDQALAMQQAMIPTYMQMLLNESNNDALYVIYHHFGFWEYPPYNYAYYQNHPQEARQAWANVVNGFRRTIGNSNALALPGGGSAASPSAITVNPPQAPISAPATGTIQGPTQQQQANVADLLAQGWNADHKTDFVAFLYKVENVMFVDEEHGQPITSNDNVISGMYPTQISLVFVNNLVTMPMENTPYPTYQHVGPAGTQVSVNFLSKGDSDGETEAEHRGVKALSSMTDLLDQQYFRMHHEWRASSSVHRMQSCVIQNQVLNMFGIRGILPDSLTTQTMPESYNTLQIGFTAAQYENTFEDAQPYRINGINSLNRTTWLNLLRNEPGILLTIQNAVSNNPNEQALLQPVFDLSSAMSGRNTSVLANWLINGNGYVSNTDLLQANPTMPTADLSTQGVNWTSINASIRSILFNAGATTTSSASQPFIDTSWYSSNIYSAMQSHQSLSFADYFVLANYPDLSIRNALSQYVSQVNLGLAKIPSTATDSYNTLLDALYNAYFDYLVGPGGGQGNAPPLAQAMQLIEHYPNTKTQAIFNQAVNTSGPGADAPNREHGAYRDLGLRNSMQAGVDFNPAFYFYDDSQDQKAVLDAEVPNAVQKTALMIKNFNIGNFFQDDAQAAASSTSSNKPGAVISTSSVNIANQTNSLNGRIQDTISLLRIPKLNMVRAFPTFKLFLMEERNQGIFDCLDNFYSYSNILEIEVIRYRDKPDTAVFVVTNMSHLLSHKLFDNTTAGRRELMDERGLALLPTTSTGDSVTSEADSALLGSSNPAGVGTLINPSGSNNAKTGLAGFMDLRDSMDPAGAIKSPPRYFALQTGSKLQIRMGYANNPDNLFPVFTGFVTDIQGDEILTVTAQGHLLELMGAEAGELRSNGYLPPAEGDYPGTFIYPGGIFEGSSSLVMDAVLQGANAKHFGHWQINDPTPAIDKYMKGFTWTAVGANVIDWTHPSSIIANILRNNYDRRSENIMVNHIINADGSGNSNPSNVRPWYYENPFIGFPATYDVPKDHAITPWMILTDVARRYPEYILMARQYGFPYGADATLIYADPNDYYISRPPMPGQSDLLRSYQTSPAVFKIWWQSKGRALFLQFASGSQDTKWVTPLAYTLMFGLGGSAAGAQGLGSSVAATALNLINTFAPPSTALLSEWSTPYANQMAAWVDNNLNTTTGGGQAFDAVCEAYVDAVNPSNQNLWTLFTGGLVQNVLFKLGDLWRASTNVPNDTRQGVLDMQRNLMAFLQQQSLSGQATPSDRFQPVRKWHYVNENIIINNGITLNENIFNAVKILDGIYAGNDSIPSYLLKVLDTTPLIINPNKNVGSHQSNQIPYAYAQSFLREELGKMYRGELVLLGQPDIEPYDVIILNDPWNSMVGPIVVDSVVHSFSQETGFISIVRPMALTTPNDRMTAPCLVGLGDLIVGINARIRSAIGTGQGNPSLSSNTQFGGQSAPGPKEQKANTAIVAGINLAADILVDRAVFVYWAISTITGGNKKNLMAICPLSRFNRPWVGGLQGWKVDDLFGGWQQSAVRFWESEFSPLLESFRTANNLTFDVATPSITPATVTP